MACPGYTPHLDAPRSLANSLTRYVGKNPYGLPNWRVCLSESRYDLRAGLFQQLPGGKLEPIVRDKHGKIQVQPITGITVKHGMYPVKKYPHDGWILERWYPNHMWGSREFWNAQVGIDGITPCLGEYPAEGDYWMQAGPWAPGHPPDLADLKNAIAQFEYEMRNRPVNLEAYIKRMMTGAQDAEVARYEQFVKDLEHLSVTEVSPIFHSTSLAASRIRQRTAESLGITSHVGL